MLHELRVHQIELEMQNEELRRAQAELDTSHARYFDFYDLAPVGYCSVGESGLILQANMTTSSLLGIARDALLQQPISRFILPQSQDVYYLMRQRIIRTLQPQSCELSMVKQDGTPFWADLEVVGVNAEAGAPILRIVLTDITEKKRAEEALRESEERYRSVIAVMAEGVVLQDASGTIVMVNQNVERLLGLGSGQLLGTCSIDPRWYAIHEDGSRFLGDTHSAMLALKTGVPQSDVIMGIHRPDGALSWISINTQPLVKPGQAQPVGVVSSFRDITENKAAEEKLRLATTLVENSPAVLFRWRAAQGWPVEHVSQNVRQFGYSAEELLSGAVPYASMVYPADLERVAAEVARYSAGGDERFAQEYRLLTRDGAVRWVDDRTTIERDAQGQVMHYQGVLTDITEKKRAEENQRAAALYARSLIEASLDPLVTINPAGKITDVNRMTEEVTGIGRERLIDTDFADYFTEPDKARAGYQEVLARGYVRDYPLTIRHRTGRTTDVLYNASVYRNEAGELQGVFAAARDVTERKRAELALRRADRALRTLSACNEALVRAANEPGLLDAICRLVVETGGYRMAWVGFPEQDAASTVRPVARHGDGGDYLATAHISWADTEPGHGPTGTAIRTGTVQIDQDFLSNPALAPWRQASIRRGYQSSIALPLKSAAAATLGVLTIYASEPDAFNEAEVALLRELAEDLAFGIETLRTRSERDAAVREQFHQAELLRQSLQDSIKAIADTVETRDPYTAGHQRRVGQLAIAVARELDLPEHEIRGIGLAASIHDLGKISVPAEILARPGKLSAIELMLLKNHAQAGFDILEDIQFPWPIASIVLQHHERQDGSGYPQGLQGEQILLESLILAVADVVEAMASHRPYRAALGIESALQEIERGRGTAYDAAVVDACARLFAEKRFAFSD